LNILFVSEVPSPFQVDFGKAVNNLSEHKYFILFNKALPPERGRHWLDFDEKFVFFAEDNLQNGSQYVLNLLRKLNIDLLIIGLPMRLNTAVNYFKIVKKSGVKIIYWNEQPFPKGNILKVILAKLYYRLFFLIIRVDMIFAIGDRALSVYSRLSKVPVFGLPYSQLLPKKERNNREISGVVRFGFSGQLIDRNNLKLILDTIIKLNKIGLSEKYEFHFFGGGPLNELVESVMKENLNVYLYKIPPKTWDDRLSIYSIIDVLVTIPKHSGWGLTVQEALSCGVPVISSVTTESARYYIEDGLNGYIVKSNSELFYILKRIIDDPKMLESLKDTMSYKVDLCNSNIVAKRFCNILQLI